MEYLGSDAGPKLALLEMASFVVLIKKSLAGH